MIYFDNAATTLCKPDCVVQAVTEAMCSLGNSGRGVHSGALSASRIIYEMEERGVQLTLLSYDSGQVSDALSTEYGIATRPGAHCAPLMHKALGTVEQGAVRFSFSHYNTKEEIEIAVSALRELAMEE